MSSAPRALRGDELRAVLRGLDVVGGGGAALDPAPSAPRSAARSLFDPVALPVVDGMAEPESGGPPALRPHELARWREIFAWPG